MLTGVAASKLRSSDPTLFIGSLTAMAARHGAESGRISVPVQQIYLRHVDANGRDLVGQMPSVQA